MALKLNLDKIGILLQKNKIVVFVQHELFCYKKAL